VNTASKDQIALWLRTRSRHHCILFGIFSPLPFARHSPSPWAPALAYLVRDDVRLVFKQRGQKKEPRDGHTTGLLHRSMAKAEETTSDRSTNTDSLMKMQ
jgi:hypothetical protein